MSSDRPRVIVTGGSGGIGGAIVSRFLSDGAVVVNIDRRPSALLPPNYTFLADIADVGDVERAFAGIDALFDGAAPDLFVACAAVSRAKPFLEVSPEEFDLTFSINVRGLFFSAQAAARRMKAVRSGGLVLISSIAAEQAWAQECVYSASKAATKSLVQALAVELAAFGVRVNAIGPGPIDHAAADMAATRADPEILRHELERTPFQRFGRPEEVAEAVALIARCPWTTGQTLYVDGGFLATGLGYFGTARNALLT
jgi:glucose 1-dehydrogenase